MKLLHTSDWHIGRSLFGRRRTREYTEFLIWLENTIIEKSVEVLLVSGDIFDTGTPGPLAQELYYGFLARISKSCCKDIIVIGGNHDSPTLLNAPKGILRSLNVHVIGCKTENPEDEVITIVDENKNSRAVICAVPFLRDRDIRTVEAGESIKDKNSKLVTGVKEHYRDVVSEAEKIRGDSGIPIIAMGHMFVAGGLTTVDDGVRELYVGTIGHMGTDIFPKAIDYLALGHLHVPQIINKDITKRYSGSPIPMGFGEAGQKKQVLLVEFDGCTPNVKEIEVPVFQELIRIKGSLEEIKVKIEELKIVNSTAWLEVIYSDNEFIGNLRDIVEELIDGSNLEIRIIKNNSVINRVLERENLETLESLNPRDVFNKCLEQNSVEEKDELIHLYNEVIDSISLGDDK